MSRDDASPATRGELRVLEHRVYELERARTEVTDLRSEIEGLSKGIERHIKQAIPAAVAAAIEPFNARLERLGHVESVVEKAHAILQEQEVRARLAAERRAQDELDRAEREAKRRYNVLLLKIFAPIALALIAAIGGAIGSHYGPPSETKKEMHQ